MVFYSFSLENIINNKKKNYKIYNKELLTIVEYLTKQRQYFLNTEKTFKVWMDYENLQYFTKLQQLNRK